MPPRGRKAKSATASASNAQSTLSFNNKSARVTKPNRQDDAALRKASSKLSAPVQSQLEEEAVSVVEEEPQAEAHEVEVSPEPEAEGTDIAIRESPRKKKIRKGANTSGLTAKDQRELAAKEVTDAQIKKYWKAEEDGRLAPRVHQSHLPMHEKILRHFDLSSQYGPCIGIPRLARWKRANALGLDPPLEVLAVLIREEDKTSSQGCGKIAYIDELGGGKAILVE